ncbi:hypothetical protein CJ030_MR2G019469 [Morella rubra]|uniref:3'-5' exonuclease domain-containing protein n=1 Tax=Morella rubra TaxID=262757 RepID=A0A6A1WGF7_9ROSI|nr:hypothetical protein CJ030_MR2G019466 [Morella rubra]KAB1222950.1 hypothetical protein CJ030_MR2G019469 [Morella rubra]
MGHYEVEVHGIKVHASVLDNHVLVGDQIDGLWSSLNKFSGADLAAFDFKVIPKCPGTALLILFAGTRCLIVQLRDSVTQSSKSLMNFLTDEEVCLVGILDFMKNYELRRALAMTECAEIGVRLADLAARVLKKPHLLSRGLVDLAAEVDLFYNHPEKVELSEWAGRVLSHEEVKFVIHDACACYNIAANLLKQL